MNPPLEKFGLLQKSNRVTFPLTWTRRIGEACDTAQNSLFAKQPVPPVTLIVRFDTERQKLSSAVQLPLMHWLTESIAPLMTTPPGFSPRPATLV